MAERTFGWIQNPSKISNLKNTVAVFDKDSEINLKLRKELIPRLIQDVDAKKRFLEELNCDEIIIPYNDLKGKGPQKGSSRTNAPCSGIVQAAIKPQKGEYTDDWSSDGFLRWGISIGFLKYCRDNDSCRISELGKQFIETKEGSKEEVIILGKAFLSYPPVIRILSLLNQKGHQTKFELGAQLGFIGEAGFTSIPQNLFLAAYCETSDTKERTRISQNIEGSSDKYARMIAKWLLNIAWVIEHPKVVQETMGGKKYSATINQAYSITFEGIQNLKMALGNSRHGKIPRIVLYEMLATKSSDKEYLRRRRAYIIQSINMRYKTIDEIQLYLQKFNIEASSSTILDDIHGLESIGISIIKTQEEKFKISDIITELSIPQQKVGTVSDLTKVKESVREKLLHVNHKYLSLIDLAFDGGSDRDFEFLTIDLLTNELEYLGMRLGDSRKPDGIISYNNQGVIIDNKAYSKGYSIPINHADEMVRYIEENQVRKENLNSNQWWNSFDNKVKQFYFLFVSSFFTGNFVQQLEYISKRKEIIGGAISVINLLFFAEKLKSGDLSYNDSFKLFNNQEIIIKL